MYIIKTIFCSDLQAQLADAENQVQSLNDRIDELETSTQESSDQYDELQAQYQAQTDTLEALREEHEATEAELEASIKIPDISAILEQAVDNGFQVEVDPPNVRHPVTDEMYNGYFQEVRTRDNAYYAYDEQTWKDILAAIHPEMKKAVGFGYPEVADCDNYSYTTSIFTALAFIKAGKHLQGAIGVAEEEFSAAIGTTHAFNVVLLNNNVMLSYEPYDGDWLGTTDEAINVADKYKIRRINFAN